MVIDLRDVMSHSCLYDRSIAHGHVAAGLAHNCAAVSIISIGISALDMAWSFKTGFGAEDVVKARAATC